MRYLLDTNHCSYLQEGHTAVVRRFQSLPPDAEVMTSVISQAELLAGVYLAPGERRRGELRRLYEQLLQSIAEILVVDTVVAERFAELETDLRRKGRPLPVNDIWIASVALANNLILVTSDEHFRYIDGLSVEDWTQG